MAETGNMQQGSPQYQAGPSTTMSQQAGRQPRCRVNLARLVLAALLVPLVGALRRHSHPASLGEGSILGGARAAAPAPKAATSKGHHVSAAAAGEESGSSAAAAAALRKRKPVCRNYGQLPQFTGTWVDHPDPEYMGIYDQATQCPGWGYDFNCREATSKEDQKPDLIQAEYRKVFKPHECELPEWDAHGFDRCMKGRRIIMIGDSLTWQMYNSLACLLLPVTLSGVATTWDKANTSVTAEYKGREWPEGRNILKQYWADVRLKGGAQIMVRCFGRYNASLWDDVFAEFGPLTERDIIIVNFGAWYPRFNLNEPKTPWEAFKLDIRDLFLDKLSKYRAQSLWRTNSPTHFGGFTGTFTAIEEGMEGVPVRQECDPAAVGEFWFRDHVVSVLKDCGAQCSNIRLLPVFDMSLPRHNSHHGTFGRGKESGFTDCRHYCTNVVDYWNVVLYSMMCF